jgi:hypothetical protein
MQYSQAALQELAKSSGRGSRSRPALRLMRETRLTEAQISAAAARAGMLVLVQMSLLTW